MPKLSNAAIGLPDLEEYLNGYSDFSFELKVVELLTQLGVKCDHGGLYRDPATGKHREFDIRAEVSTSIGENRHLLVRFSIECKNLRENFPVLITTVPRSVSESYHHSIVSNGWRSGTNGHTEGTYEVCPLEAGRSIYVPNEPVGKALAQIGRLADGSIHASDAEVFDKWAQCLASADDLVNRVIADIRIERQTIHSTIVPALVVPDDRLWTVHYTPDGALSGPPVRVDRCSLFVGRRYLINGADEFFLSHLEFFTMAGLRSFLVTNVLDEDGLRNMLPLCGRRVNA